MNRPQQFTTVDLTPRKYHGYAVILFILGTLFPPLGMTYHASTGHLTDVHCKRLRRGLESGRISI